MFVFDEYLDLVVSYTVSTNCIDINNNIHMAEDSVGDLERSCFNHPTIQKATHPFSGCFSKF